MQVTLNREYGDRVVLMRNLSGKNLSALIYEAIDMLHEHLQTISKQEENMNITKNKQRDYKESSNAKEEGSKAN